MAVDFDEVKINVRSLLTISQKNLSIRQLQNDYYEQEGHNIPFKSLGYSSVIELLQNMKDVLTVPPNPNESSLLSLVINNKTSHLRNLVIKQRSKSTNKKKKKHKTFENYKNKSFHNCKSTNIKKNFEKSNPMFPTINEHGNQLSSSNYEEHSNLNGNQIKQNIINGEQGYVTDKLRSYIENYISKNQMPIDLKKLKELVKHHPDYSILKVNCMVDLIKRMNHFLNISETEITLKNVHEFKTNETEDIPFNFKDINNLITKSDVIFSQPISNINKSQNKIINDHKHVNNNENNNHNELSDKQIISHLSENIQSNDVVQNNRICISSNNVEKVTSKTQPTEINEIDYVEFYKNKNCIKELQNVYVNKQRKQDKRQNSDSNKNERYSNGNELNCLSSNLNGNLNVLNDTENLFLRPKQNNHDAIKNMKNIPNDVLLKITYIYKLYHDGLNIDNFKLIYNNIFHTFFDPVVFGFTSIKQLYNDLIQITEIRNNMFYSEEILLINANILTTQKKIMEQIELSNNLKIAFHIDQLLVFQVNSNSNVNMILVEQHSPASFYLQYKENAMELKNLMDKMQDFYDIENTNYFVQPEHILPGFHYASSFTTYFSNVKQWLRVKILREIDLLTIEVIYVDYGTIDIISKTQLKYLKNEFCHLPCQAIHCCLTGFNEFDTISPEVTDAFWEIVDNKPVKIQIDQNLFFNDQYQILHVTLYQSINLRNINDILTILHVNH